VAFTPEVALDYLAGAQKRERCCQPADSSADD